MGAKGLGSRAIIGEFYVRLEQDIGQTYIPLISNRFDSDQESETYKWLGMAPAMREWVGGRQAKGFRENGLTIVNKKFEATLEVLVDEIRRDKTSQVMIRIGEMAQRVNAHWAKLLTALLEANGLSYDGKAFFATDHEEGDSGAQSNAIQVDVTTPGAPTAGEMETAILKAVEQVLAFKDDTGEPMNEEARQFLVMVGSPYFSAASAALRNAVVIEGGQARTSTLVNLAGFNFQLAPSVRLNTLAAANKFLVFRTDAEARAMIRQEEEEVSVAAIAEGSELEFNEDKHHYGVKAIRNVGYGFWQRACQVELT